MARTKRTARPHQRLPVARAKLPSKPVPVKLTKRAQSAMRSLRGHIVGAGMAKPQATKFLVDVFNNQCNGKVHKMDSIGPLLVEAVSTGARDTALYAKIDELQTKQWEQKGIVETVTPAEKQAQSAWVQSFSAKGGMSVQ